MVCARHLGHGGEHVSCWQLFALGRPALRAAWGSPAASGGWDTKTWSARGLADWCVGEGEPGEGARARIRPTEKMTTEHVAVAGWFETELSH